MRTMCRAVGAGDAMAPPDFGRSVNLLSTRGKYHAHQINTGPPTPGFSDLPTALLCVAGVKNVISDWRPCHFGISSKTQD
jgi:hypothetical protein